MKGVGSWPLRWLEHTSISEDRLQWLRATLLEIGSHSLQQMLLCIWLPSQLSGKQVTETHLPVLHQLVCTVHISCWEENGISWKENKLMLCSLGCYITLNFRMLQTSCFPNTSHFEIYTLAMLRPSGLWLSFLTCHSVLPLRKVWIEALGCLRHRGKGCFLVVWQAESQFLFPPPLRFCVLPSSRVKRGNCSPKGPWLWSPFALSSSSGPHSGHPLHFCSHN